MKWKKTFNNILHKCFKKVRIVKNKKMAKSDNLLRERVKLKTEIKSTSIDEDMKCRIEERIKQIEDKSGKRL